MTAHAKTVQVQSKFCRVCMNAGKTETEYRSHFTKNEKGIVLCPTILNATCSYCKEIGHFKGECPILKTKDKMKTLKIVVPNNNNVQKDQKTNTRMPTKSYRQAIIEELFDSDSDEAETPTTITSATITTTTTTVSRVPLPAKRKRDITHDWADDEYWCDTDEEI